MYTWLRGHPRTDAFLAFARQRPVIALDYPVHPRPRWGHGQPAHQELKTIIEAHRLQYRSELTELAAYAGSLAKIPVQLWNNAFMPGLDAATLYCFIASRRPRSYVEVGSGISTAFAAQAVSEHALDTKVTSVDPLPRADVNELCDEVIRRPLEETDLTLFSQLQAGDMVFIDNSHQAFQNSDVTVFFLEILPRLPAGVLVGIHDIFLPDDYPPSYAGNYYSEQYLLAAYLLGGGHRIKIILPNWFVSQDNALVPAAAPLVAFAQAAGADIHGGIFWFEIVA